MSVHDAATCLHICAAKSHLNTRILIIIWVCQYYTTYVYIYIFIYKCINQKNKFYIPCMKKTTNKMFAPHQQKKTLEKKKRNVAEWDVSFHRFEKVASGLTSWRSRSSCTPQQLNQRVGPPEVEVSFLQKEAGSSSVLTIIFWYFLWVMC